MLVNLKQRVIIMSYYDFVNLYSRDNIIKNDLNK